MDNKGAINYLRHRRSTYFFGDAGPALPAGMRARWRLSPGDPRGWQANVVGFVEGPVLHLPAVLDIACGWFDEHHTDTWIEMDDRSILFQHQDLVETRGFRLCDDWDAMICRSVVAGPPSKGVVIAPAFDEAGLETSAWIAEQIDAGQPLDRMQSAVQRRLRRYRQAAFEWNTQFVVAYVDGRPVGTARLTSERLPVIVGVATLPEARGRGVATTITAALAGRAVLEHGACALYVERESQAQRIYRRLGFEPLYRSRAWRRDYQGAG
jgi:GNAT superfamily N-acetyltransferase